MKFLKRFNEVNDPYDEYISNLYKICNDALVYLIDEGFSISIQDNKVNYKPIRIDVNPEGNGLKSSFKWSEVKNDIIPLLELLSEKYEFDDFEPIHFSEVLSDTYTYTYTLDDVINDSGYFINDEVSFYNDKNEISYLSIYLKQPKPLD